MALDVDAILDRRQIRRKLSFWRISALIALVLAVLFALSASGAFKNLAAKPDHIARVAITGTITTDRPLLKMLKDLGENDQVKGVMLAINSPGGTTAGGEAIFNAVRELAEKKPVVTSVDALAASAGYMIATASDHIVARRSSIVGSIGVIFQYPQASALLDKIGLKIEEIKSSPLKAEPSPFHPPPPGAKKVIQELIDDSYNWFVDLVTDRRPLDRAQVLVLADGRVFSGDRSLKNKLIDAVGGEDTARQWLIDEKQLDKDIKVINWKPKRQQTGGLFSNAFSQWFLKQTGLDVGQLNADQLPSVLPKRLFLDGLLSIWEN